jgi:hypothetical protein
VKPTRLHYFYAQNWPAWIWFTAIPLLAVLLMAKALGTTPDLSALEVEAKSYLFLLGITWLLGFCVAGLVGWFILGPLYHYRAELNGYPFRPGDRVEILVRANRGRIVLVAEVRDWRGDLRVILPESASRKGKTMFHFAQVIKVNDAEPSVAADRPQAAEQHVSLHG